MMKFFRKHRKAVSPVIAVMLLVAVAVAAVGAYFIWFRSFQTQTQKSVQEQSGGALGGGLQILSMTDDGSYYYIVMKNTTGSEITLNRSVSINPGGTVDINVSVTDLKIASQSSKTLPIPSIIVRGTTRTFTFTGKDADLNEVVLVNSYTDS